MSGYPGPFKCPDCGVWWAGFEHRCPLKISTSGSGVTYTAICICDQKRGPTGSTVVCPVHDIHVTYTTFGTSDATS